jgi:hypothetical protein
MPFLGAETALGCVGARQVVTLSLSLATAAKPGGIFGKDLPGDIWAGFTGLRQPA